ncbi:hypothetical protein FF011L_24870 [Roseimaritima multifibrata]|uniref:DUF58 domain-containing protein n=1 Tax=Roseimaritima multifibrata TaxID=1930274 RepID=A0A517MFP4_9BACT|nr:DUF58 domain-containing protein [Roseimaritima multifibrata]QDS93714.1 hypothetical protein FF011L_24870 [Roseimaritima multifibrata]
MADRNATPISNLPAPPGRPNASVASADGVNEVSEESQGGVGWLGWAAGFALLVLLGMLFGAALWLYAALAALGMLLLNRYLAYTWSQSVVAVRATGKLEVETGATVPVEIEVRNRGRLPIAWLLAEDLVPRSAIVSHGGARSRHGALEIQGERLRVMLLKPGQTQFIRYSLKCHRRGYYQIGPLVLETGDLMGFHRRYRIGAVPQYLMVMPKVIPLSGFDVASRRPIGEVRIRERMMEDPSRLQGIRQWQQGDSLRQVHWAATARTGTLHSKIYEQTSVVGATLVVDLHEKTNPPQNEPMRSELAITMAASIASALYEMNQPVGLVSNGRDAVDRIRTSGWASDFRTRKIARQQAAMKAEDDRLRPVVIGAGRGPLGFQAIQRQLASLERTDGLTLAELLIEAESRIARDTSLLVIAQACDPASIVALVGLSRRGWAVSVILNVFDATEFANSAGPLISGGIAVMQLREMEQIPEVCRQVVLR